MLAAGKLIGKAAGKALSRYGFATADLIARWPHIIGPELSGLCQPERIIWPHKAPASADRAGSQRLAGTLVLRAEPGRAMELHYQTSQILEKVNRYFGYEAIVSVKFKQAAMARSNQNLRPVRQVLADDKAVQVRQRMKDIDSEELKSALMRLANGVLGTRKT